MLIVEIAAAGVATLLAMAVARHPGGSVRFVSCEYCGHLGLATVSRPLRPCAHCGHGWLVHPMYEPLRARVEPPRPGSHGPST